MTMAVISSKFRQTIVFLYYFLILATPLIWSQANSELFEFPKMTFVYVLTTIITTIWLARMVISKKIIFARSWLDYPIWFYLAANSISTLLSIHFHTSMFGYYTRFHGGLLSLICYTLLYHAFVSNLTKTEGIRAVVMMFSSGIISALIAIPEHFGIAFSCFVIRLDTDTSFWQKLVADCWVQDIVTRIFGTFGQPNWLAAYLTTLIPLSWALLPLKLNEYKRQSWLRYTMIIVGTLLMVMTVWYTKSRSGLLGLGFGLLVLIIATGLFYKKKILVGLSTFSLIIGIIGLSLFLIRPDFLVNTVTPLNRYFSNSVNPDPVLDTLSQGGTDSFAIRQIVWRGAWDIFVHHPLFGTGVETFAYAYYNYRPIEHNLVSEWDFLYNKAHNEVLNILANTGAIGLISYLSIWVGFSWLIIRYSRTNNNKSHTVYVSRLMWALLAGQAGLFVSNLLGFSTVSVSVLMYLSWAFVGLHTRSFKPVKIPNDKVGSVFIVAAVGVGLVGIFFLYSIGRYYYADTRYAHGKSAESQNNLATAIESYQEAIELSPYQAQYYDDYADSLSKATLSFAAEGQTDTTQRFANQTLLSSAKTLELNPVHINFHKSQAGVFIRLSAIDTELLNVAKEILQRGSRLAPTDAKIIYNLGLLELDQAATDSAQQYFEQAVQMKPNYEAARMEVAQIYEQQEKYDLARDQYSYILNYIAPQNKNAQSAFDRLNNPEEDTQ
jgi:hypothetical protein